MVVQPIIAAVTNQVRSTDMRHMSLYRHIGPLLNEESPVSELIFVIVANIERVQNAVGN